MYRNLSFENIDAFYLLLFIPILIFWKYWRERKGMYASTGHSNVEHMRMLKKTSSSIRHAPFIMRLVALSLLITALARPQIENQIKKVFSEGIDIVICLDLSTSMLAEDFHPTNRIGAAKSVSQQFIDNRKTDRIGLVVFAAQAFTQCPATLDYNLVKSLIGDLEAGQLQEDGTAIGTAIITAINRLRDSDAKSRIIILLTDGENNAGEVDPITASQFASTLGIKIYTIGAGTRGYANYPYNDPVFGKRYTRIKVNVDDEGLSKIASTAGGRYFRATDLESLKKTYSEINLLEKTKVEVESYTEYKEKFLDYLIPGVLFLLLEFVLVHTRLRKFP